MVTKILNWVKQQIHIQSYDIGAIVIAITLQGTLDYIQPKIVLLDAIFPLELLCKKDLIYSSRDMNG